MKLRDFDTMYVVMMDDRGCWEWLGKPCSGYGSYNYTAAHIASYKIHGGEIPKGMCVCHTCDNTMCVNPKHLFLGTVKDNNQDRARKKRTVIPSKNKMHCPHGHEYTIENTYFWICRGSICRQCRTCHYERNKKARIIKQEARVV
jgi:hypothetical protein